MAFRSRKSSKVTSQPAADIFKQPNAPYTTTEKWAFKYLPGWMRWERFSTYWAVDKLYLEYIKNPDAEPLRSVSEKQARDYMTSKCPPQYLEKIMPDYPVGCKRRVMDPGYLDALHRDNIDLCDEKIARIDETGIQLQNGTHEDFDIIVYATGFYTQEFLSPMTILGRGGKSLTEHWKETHGCQAYMGTTVSGFPNMAIMFGPNASPAHNSVIFTLEVQAAYITNAIVKPIWKDQATAISVRRSAEDYDCSVIQQKLGDSVWHAGCVNWQLDKNGRNCTSFPGYVRSFWWKLYSPRFQDYDIVVSPTRVVLSRWLNRKLKRPHCQDNTSRPYFERMISKLQPWFGLASGIAGVSTALLATQMVVPHLTK